MANDEDLVKAFLAKNQPKQIATNVAYGVDKEEDKRRRAQEAVRRREVKDRDRNQWVETEQDHDIRMEQAHDAFFVGDKEEGFRLLGERRLSRPEVEHHPDAIRRGDGKWVKLNKY